MSVGEAMLQTIDTETKAYLLGVIAALGRPEPDRVVVALERKDLPVVELLEARTCRDIPLKRELGAAGVAVISQVFRLDVCRWLGWDATTGKQTAPASGGKAGGAWPNISSQLSHHFVRGYFDAVGRFRAPKPGRELTCELRVAAPELRQGMKTWLDSVGPAWRGDGAKLQCRGHAALDFLGQLYGDAKVYRERHRARFLAWAHHVPFLSGRELSPPSFRYRKLEPGAVAPFKSRVSDSGYDLTLLAVRKRIGLVTLYGTGLMLEPPYGWYFDVVPRSSIIKSGYIVANNVGVIDRGYRGEVMVPLLKLDPGAPELALPARVVQIIPRPVVHFAPEEVADLSKSQRGGGGFGSTG